ncbi:hypothetical protein [Cupriavidus sp. TMH.W2]|uniref:hypothetical protein n=1 Tax=Cupriavidus sp. TMH.W2 TaxID=3434465 RepID=UPI003D772A5A
MLALFNQVRDPYERKARVFPGLLTALPLLVPLLWIFGPRNPVLTALLGLVASCGAIYALASIARGRGKRLEERLVSEWGGMPTTLILRHRDSFLDPYSTARYHSLITAKLGIVMPSRQDEQEDPASADQLYVGATRQLREATRGSKHALLLKENIAYGFHRNMLAMKPMGITTCCVGIPAGLLLSHAVTFWPLSFNASALLSPGGAGGVTLVASLTILCAWLYFTPKQVKQMGYVYAERLFESLSQLPNRRPRSKVVQQDVADNAS